MDLGASNSNPGVGAKDAASETEANSAVVKLTQTKSYRMYSLKQVCVFLSLSQGSLLDSLSRRVLTWVKFDSMLFHSGPALTPCSLLPLLQYFSNIYIGSSILLIRTQHPPRTLYLMVIGWLL